MGAQNMSRTCGISMAAATIPLKFGRLTLEIAELFASVSRRAIPRTRHLNDLVWVFKTIGFERHTSGQADNPLMTGTANDTLDLFGGWDVLPTDDLTVRHTLRNVLDGDLPEPSRRTHPHGRRDWPTSTFFPNFWTESEAAAQKFARSATGRTEILYCDHAFHRAG